MLCFDKPARLFQSKYRQRNIEFERRKQEVQFVKELIHFVVVSILDIFTETSVSLYLSMQNKQYWQIQFLFIGSSHHFTFCMRKYNQPHSMFSWEAGLFHNTIKLPALFSLIPKLLQTQTPLRYFTFNMFA